MDIPALKIRSSVPECVLTTTFEWYNTNWVSSDGTTKGRWEERRTNIDSERFVVDTEDVNVMNAKVTPKYRQPAILSVFCHTFRGAKVAKITELYRTSRVSNFSAKLCLHFYSI